MTCHTQIASVVLCLVLVMFQFLSVTDAESAGVLRQSRGRGFRQYGLQTARGFGKRFGPPGDDHETLQRLSEHKGEVDPSGIRSAMTEFDEHNPYLWTYVSPMRQKWNDMSTLRKK